LISTGTLMSLSYYIGRNRMQPVRVRTSVAAKPALADAAQQPSKQRHAA
jgi:hypothetical protein